jgi:hypothetical protein
VAACLVSFYRLHQALGIEALERRLDLLWCKDLDSQMINAVAGLGIFKQYQFERRAVDSKIGVPRALFVGLYPK